MEPEMEQERVSFHGEEARLEGLLEYDPRSEASRGALLLAPHPHFAGDMSNNVVRALSAALARSGLVVLSFDYRGVGGSQPPELDGISIFDYWREIEEQRRYEPPLADARAAAAFLREAIGSHEPLLLAGYSFGSILAALMAGAEPAPARAVLLGPPLKRFDDERIRACLCETLLIQGERDFLYDPGLRDSVVDRLGPRARFELFEGADHFFRGIEDRLALRVVEAIGG